MSEQSSAQPDPKLGHSGDVDATTDPQTEATKGKAGGSDEDAKQREEDRKLASRIADIIAGSLDRIKPITNMITKVLRFCVWS